MKWGVANDQAASAPVDRGEDVSDLLRGTNRELLVNGVGFSGNKDTAFTFLIQARCRNHHNVISHTLVVSLTLDSRSA